MFWCRICWPNGSALCFFVDVFTGICAAGERFGIVRIVTAVMSDRSGVVELFTAAS